MRWTTLVGAIFAIAMMTTAARAEDANRGLTKGNTALVQEELTSDGGLPTVVQGDDDGITLVRRRISYRRGYPYRGGWSYYDRPRYGYRYGYYYRPYYYRPYYYSSAWYGYRPGWYGYPYWYGYRYGYYPY